MAGAFKIYYKLPHNFGPLGLIYTLLIYSFSPSTTVPRALTARWVRTALPPIASISSKKIRQAFLVLAISKSSRTILAPCTQTGRFPLFQDSQQFSLYFTFFFNFSFQPPVFFLSETHLSDVLLHQLGADHPDEARVCSVGHGTCTEGLPSARWSKQQHALRGLDAQIDKPLGLEDRRQYCSLKIKIKLILWLCPASCSIVLYVKCSQCFLQLYSDFELVYSN